MDGQRGVTRQLDDDELRAPADGLDSPTGDRDIEGLRRMGPDRPWPADPRAGDRRPDDARPQVARDRLDFGKLGHRGT
jgi:hypothetical protein